jgi:hypothetical protein
VSAASLGQPVGISFGLSSNSLSYGGAFGVGDFALGPGALRLVGAHPKNFEGYAIAYGAPLVIGIDAAYGDLPIGGMAVRNPASL